MKSHSITSRQNDTFKAFKSLLGSKGITERGQAIISGRKTVPELIRDYPSRCLGLIVREDMARLAKGDVPNLYVLSPELFEMLDVFGSGYPLLLVQTPEMPSWEPSSRRKGCRLVLPFQEPSNVGAILRSAAAFGAEEVILLQGAAHPFHPRSSRAASGTLFLHEYSTAASPDLLKSSGLPFVALDMAGEDLARFDFPESFFLVPGAEGPGLRLPFAPDFKVAIKMNPKVESLNAAVAASIALFQYSKLHGRK